MAINSYASLQSAIADWLARPGDSLVTPEIPTMIQLFESEANRRLRTIQNLTNGTITTTAGDNTYQLATDFLEMRNARVSSLNPRVELQYLTPDQFDTIAIADESGTPQVFTIDSGTLGMRIRLGPNPDLAYTITYGYYSALPALSNGVVNWLLTKAPDAYLFGSLAEAEAFVGHDERIALWLQRRDAVLATVQQTWGPKAMFGGGTLQIKTDTGNP